MSGIAGIIRFDGAPVEPGLVERMTAAMAHRGPDGCGHWRMGSVALGHCMFRTTPESLEESQPLANEDESLVLVLDGRVDNWEELRRKLLGRGTVLRDRSDAELVLRAYETWGRDCVSHIDGDFALVVWDSRRRTAFCARDRMGNRSLHYLWDGSTLAFSTDLHPLFALPWFVPLQNEGLLSEYLAAEWYSRDETLWQGILRLTAAHVMEVDHRGPRPENYWTPDPWATLPYSTEGEYFEHYRALLAETVARQSRSHRPVAFQVSGGLDSSAVFCVAEQLHRRGSLKAPSLAAYTFAFHEDSKANEVEYARAVSTFLGVPIHEVPPSRMTLSWYDERARVQRDFPGYPNGVMCAGLMQRAADDGSRVVVTGQGGDHWLDGTRTYYAEELASHNWPALWDAFSADARAGGPLQAVEGLLRHGLFRVLPAPLRMRIKGMVQRVRGGTHRDPYWLSPAMRNALEQRRNAAVVQGRSRPGGHFREQLFWNLYDGLMAQVIERFEREGARAGVELRHPFWDHRMAQFAFSTPERLRLRGARTKYLHVGALDGVLPPGILARTSKAEFSCVFRDPLLALKRAFETTIARDRAEWFVPGGLARLYQQSCDLPHAGLAPWALWGIYACDRVIAHR